MTDLVALLEAPERAADVPAAERAAVLEALAVQEARCTLARAFLVAAATRDAAASAPARDGAPYTLAEAAALLRKSPAWVRRHARSGALPARKMGKSWLFPRDALERLWRARGRGA